MGQKHQKNPRLTFYHNFEVDFYFHYFQKPTIIHTNTHIEVQEKTFYTALFHFFH